MAKFSITGDKKLDRKLKKLGSPKLIKKVIKKGLRNGSKPIQKEAKRNAPVGKTGQLKKNVKLRAQKRSRKSIGVNVQVGEGDFKGDQFYAAFIEYGTSKMPARPFMRPAWDKNKDKTKQSILDEIKLAILNEAKKN